jgi:hypothetical protein
MMSKQEQVSDTARKERVTVDPPSQDVDPLDNPTVIETDDLRGSTNLHRRS